MPQFRALLATLRVVLCPARMLQLVQLCVCPASQPPPMRYPKLGSALTIPRCTYCS